MRPIAYALLAFSLPALFAADPAGVGYWPAAQMKTYGKKLAPKINELKVATEQLDKYGKHYVMVAYREASGEAEVHETVVDVFVVEAGEATLVLGGKVIGGKSTGPGEIRGKSIEGGVTKKLLPGDVVHIPANLPHQVTLAPGAKPFTYLIVKIEN
jgi:mannose-6-phosphate isomerase-like protein (cupin superfamily)